jgi:superfamily II DNA or RNA helicase
MPTAVSTTSIQLRDYQQQDLDNIRAAIRRGSKSICYVLPTGGGKTTVASFMIQGAVERGKRVLWFAHRRELILQPSARLDEMGINHGIIMANHPRCNPALPVQVASIDTAVRREITPPDMIIVDEAHHARSDSYTEVIKKLNAPFVIGITATPCRLDGRGLGDIFEELVIGPTVSDLMTRGYLVPDETYSWPVDTRNVKLTAGDFNQKQANDLMSSAKLVGNVIDQWKKRCSDRATIVFASGIGHSRLLQRRFQAEGVTAEHIDGNTPTDERDRIISDVKAGRVQVVCNYGVLTEGTDIPVVSCIVNCRLTQSLSLWLQMAGRGLRAHPGKSNCIIHDHAGAARLHGLPSQPQEWKLSTTISSSDKKSPRLEPVDKVRVCPDCGHVQDRAETVCGGCGYVFKMAAIAESNDDLEKMEAFAAASPAKRRSDYFHWLWEQNTKTRRDGQPYSIGYAYAKYMAKYGIPPLYQWRSEYKQQRAKELVYG